MNGWHEIWSHKNPLWVRILFVYILPIAGILFFVYFNFHVYVNVLPRASVYGGFFGISLRYIVVLFFLFVIFLLSRMGFRSQIKVYKEGIWLNSTDIDLLVYKIKTKRSRPERWIEWKDVKRLSILEKIRFKQAVVFYINVVTKDEIYPLVLDLKETISLKEAVIKAKQKDKLKKAEESDRFLFLK